MARRMRFVTWCKKDPEDETKIVYTFKMKEWDGTMHTEHFTSETSFELGEKPNPFEMLERVRYAWVESIERKDDAWHVVLYED